FKILVEYLLRIGVREIHCRFLAPKFVNPCFLGVNIGTRDELGAVQKQNGKYRVATEQELKNELKVNSLHYLSLEGMAKSLGMTGQELKNSHCTGCLDYNYPFDMRSFDSTFEKTPYAKSL